MKSIPIEVLNSEDSELKLLLKAQLKRQLVIGMSYGAKATAQTIKDIINNHTKHKQKEQEEDVIPYLSTKEKDDLLSAIIHFINTTVSSDENKVAQAISDKI